MHLTQRFTLLPIQPTAGRLLDRIRVLLAGRAAEEIMLGSPSTYSNADLKVRM